VPNQPHRVFPPFRLDSANAQLWRGEEEISLRPKTFEVLRYLVDHAGELVTKAALLDAVWAGLSVSDSMPANCVAELRRVLDDDARTPRFIETAHRRGYRFIAQVTTAIRTEPVRQPIDAPKGPRPIVVGREDELEQMRKWYSQVHEGRRHVIFVGGEAGIGKTTFIQEFLHSVAAENASLVGHGQCVEQYGSGEPYMPVLEALSRLGREADGRRVVEFLHKFAPTWLAQMPALLTREQRVGLQSEIQGVTQQRMLREMTEALEALTAESPLVLLLEDLHWSDFSTLELISAIARRREPARLLIVGTYRPVEILAKEHPLRTMKQELELHRYCEELRLRLLSEENVAGYLSSRLDGDGVKQFNTLAPVIYARTDGNPLFMVNVVDYLLGRAGLMMRGEAASELESFAASRFDPPRSIREMIERNLERLKPEEQAVLEGASAVGPEFSAASVAAALERPEEEIEACCTGLSRREQFIGAQGPVTWPDGTIATGFRFHHALYQEVLYGRLPAGYQLLLHQRIALREEAGYGERASEIAGELAYHYSRTNDRHKAIQYCRLAAERAVTRGAVVEAESHYRVALKLVDQLAQSTERDRHELELQMALGAVLWSSRSWSHPEAGRTYASALKLAEKLDDAPRTVAVLHGLVGAALGSGKFRLARDLGERMLAAAERSADRAALCAAQTRYGETLIWRGQYAEARKHLELGSAYYDSHDRSELNLMGLDAPAVAAIDVLLLGFPDQARQLMNEAGSRVENFGHPFWVGLVYLRGGSFSGLLRDAQKVLEYAQALRGLAAKQPVWTGAAEVNTGRALMLQGRWQEGASYLHNAIVFYKEVGLASQLMSVKLDEAELFAHQDRIEDGLALITEALADSEELTQIRSPAFRLRADLLARNGAEASIVEAAYRESIECAHVQGAKYYELQATTAFAQWLRSQNRRTDAHTILAHIYNWFTEGFDAPALIEAKGLLDELSDNRPHRRSTKPRTTR
jgi:DNA-binding winged helix-turn-helix (wHTH) protein/tetratricopeptide (TPR) repeat protein